MNETNTPRRIAMKRFAAFALVAILALAANPLHAQTAVQAASKWVGTENLPGFGRLSFLFVDPVKVTMIDAKETSHGTWRIDESNKVVLSFYNGQTEYVGTIQGKEMKGTATNGKITWDWQVVNTNPPIAVAPTPAPAPNSGSGSGPASVAKLTPKTLPDLLKKHGFQFKIETPEVGAPYCVLPINDKDHGWNFIVEASVDARGTMWLLMRLDQATDLKAAKLTQLLEANNALAPCFFLYRAEDTRICLKLECLPNNLSNDLMTLMRVTRESQSIWQIEKMETP
jgi:hypothetical protein